MLFRLISLISVGFIWLFVFSIPINQDKRLFDAGYDYIVDTKPVHWITGKVKSVYNSTQSTSQEITDEVIETTSQRLSELTQSKKTKN